MVVKLELNEDLEFILKKLSKRRKQPIGRILNDMLLECIQKYDDDEYEKTKVKSGNSKG